MEDIITDRGNAGQTDRYNIIATRKLYNYLDLNPNEADHSSHLTLMPEPGVPLDVTIRLVWIFG